MHAGKTARVAGLERTANPKRSPNPHHLRSSSQLSEYRVTSNNDVSSSVESAVSQRSKHQMAL
jgi:hypothetical protein